MLCYCSSCQLLFDSNAIQARNSEIRLENIRVECIKCGLGAKALDGTFRFDSDGVQTLLSGPQFTVDLLMQLQALAQRAKFNNLLPDEFVSDAEKLNSILGFLKYCVPKTNKEMKDFLAWLIPTIIAIIALKSC
jgi:hypothetical protein